MGLEYLLNTLLKAYTVGPDDCLSNYLSYGRFCPSLRTKIII